MLAVLSEIHCLDYLNNKGIYPDEYFTDFEMFKNRCVSYKDATIVVILAGICRFSRKHVVELIKLQYKRMENEADRGIVNVFVFADTKIANLDKYYKFQDNMDVMDSYSKLRKTGSNVDVWVDVDKYQTQTAHEVAIYLSDYDTGDASGAVGMIKAKYSSEDELIRLIKCPDIKSIVQGK